MKRKALVGMSMIVALALFNACATLISGTKQKVTFHTNEPGAMIKINDDQTIAGGETIKLKRKQDYSVIAEKEGYLGYEIDLKSTTNPWIYGNITLFPAALIVGSYFAGQKETVQDGYWIGDQYYDLSYEQPKEPEATRGILLLATSYLYPLLPVGVDFLTGASRRFQKEVYLNLAPLPAPVDPNNTLTTSVQTVNVKFDPGSKIGSVKNKKGQTMSDITWQQTVNTSFEDLIIQANNDFNALGFNISGLRNINEDMVQSGRESYYLEAEIKKMDYNVLQRSFTDQETECTVEVTWRLLEPKSKRVVYHNTFKSTGTSQTTNDAVAVYRAMRSSAHQFIEDPEFRKLMAKNGKPEAATVNTNSAEVSMPGVLEIQAEMRGQTLSVAQVAAASKDAVVTIITPSGHGSGFLIDADGYLITNAHVVDGFDNLSVKFSNGFSFVPEVISIDKEADLALLKVAGNGFPFLRISAIGPELGEEVMVIGTPAKEDLSQSVTRGVVSGMRLMEGQKYIQTDAGISPGNSGGPMLDMYGQVVGIVTQKLVGGGVEAVGFGIPTDVALKKLNITMR